MDQILARDSVPLFVEELTKTVLERGLSFCAVNGESFLMGNLAD
jgi:hypothetical protein